MNCSYRFQDSEHDDRIRKPHCVNFAVKLRGFSLAGRRLNGS